VVADRAAGRTLDGRVEGGLRRLFRRSEGAFIYRLTGRIQRGVARDLRRRHQGESGGCTWNAGVREASTEKRARSCSRSARPSREW